MDLDVSHFELTVANDSENRLNASPAKEEYKKEVRARVATTTTRRLSASVAL